MSSDFMNRFKGKAQTMDRNGPTAIVENSFKPIKPSAHKDEHHTGQTASQHTRMDINSIQRNYLNFPNEYKQVADPRMQMQTNPQYMPMAPMFMPPIYDVNQLNYAPNNGYAMPQQYGHQFMAPQQTYAQPASHYTTQPSYRTTESDIDSKFNHTDTRVC